MLAQSFLAKLLERRGRSDHIPPMMDSDWFGFVTLLSESGMRAHNEDFSPSISGLRSHILVIALLQCDKLCCCCSDGC